MRLGKAQAVPSPWPRRPLSLCSFVMFRSLCPFVKLDMFVRTLFSICSMCSLCSFVMFVKFVSSLCSFVVFVMFDMFVRSLCSLC